MCKSLPRDNIKGQVFLILKLQLMKNKYKAKLYGKIVENILGLSVNTKNVLHKDHKNNKTKKKIHRITENCGAE